MQTTPTTALVTGAGKGIGAEVALTLAARGYRVIACARTAADLTALASRHDGIEPHALDVCDPASVARVVRALQARNVTLDVLVNNAGILLDCAPPSALPLELVRATYETNVFAAITVTQMLLPLMYGSAHPRIVNVSSGLGSFANRTDPSYSSAAINALAYQTSKSALNAVTLCFAKELGERGFKINAADPGYTSTALNGFSGPRTTEQAARVIVRLATLDDDGPNGGFFDEEGVVGW